MDVAVSEIKRLFARIRRELGLSRECLSTEMINEIDRLGLSRDWFDRLVKDEGLEFAGFCINARSREAALFEKWFARTKLFVAQCREKSPFPDSENLSFHDRASLTVLVTKFEMRQRYLAAATILLHSLRHHYTYCLTS